MPALACPLCKPARALAPVDPDITPPLLRCPGCNGIWASAAAAQDTRRRYGRRHPILRQPTGAHLCRRCRKRMPTTADRCPSCKAGQALACLDCGKPMARVRAQTCVVDLCRPCRSTWLDAGELALLAAWADRPPSPPPPATSGSLAFDGTLLEPAGEVVAQATVEVAGHAAAGAVEVAGGAVVEVVQSTADVTVEAVGGILAALFDGL